MGFELLPPHYNDDDEQKKILAIQEYIHYETVDQNKNPTGKYYADKNGKRLTEQQISDLLRLGYLPAKTKKGGRKKGKGISRAAKKRAAKKQNTTTEEHK